MDFPLRGVDLCLRPFQVGDAEHFHAAALESVDSVGAWLPWCRPDYSLENARNWINTCIANMADGTAYDMGIFSIDGEQLLGGIGINLINVQHNFGNIGYWVRASQQRHGVALDALRLIADFGLHELSLTRLEIVTAETNLASRQLAEKIGAQFEGMARNRLLVNGRPHTAAMYALTPQQ